MSTIGLIILGIIVFAFLFGRGGGSSTSHDDSKSEDWSSTRSPGSGPGDHDWGPEYSSKGGGGDHDWGGSSSGNQGGGPNDTTSQV